jgi:membrane protein
MSQAVHDHGGSDRGGRGEKRESARPRSQGGNAAVGGESSVGASKPASFIPSRGTLFEVAKNTMRRIGADNLTLVAAGVAFYAMTAIFPAIAALVSIYGVFADPRAVEAEIADLSRVLPQNSASLLTDAVRNFSGKSQSSLSVAFAVSVALALWGARSGVASLMTGLNIANETTEKRGFMWQQVVALALTVGTVLFAIAALAAIAVVPAILAFLPIGADLNTLVDLGRWPLLALLACLWLAVIYRFGPCREVARWRWITWGAAIATILWLFGSVVFSFYVSRFGSYDATYGSLAAPVILLLWFWLTALAVLISAEVDADLERGNGRRSRPVPREAP